jgi:hypothetical protein
MLILIQASYNQTSNDNIIHSTNIKNGYIRIRIMEQ